jgi:molybdenum cofactor biosynthesis protein B
MDGFATLFLMVSHAKIGTSAIQTRATAGVAGATYIFCLPGSPGACKTRGTRSWCTSSTTATARATSSRSCLGSRRAKAKGATV